MEYPAIWLVEFASLIKKKIKMQIFENNLSLFLFRSPLSFSLYDHPISHSYSSFFSDYLTSPWRHFPYCLPLSVF